MIVGQRKNRKTGSLITLRKFNGRLVMPRNRYSCFCERHRVATQYRTTKTKALVEMAHPYRWCNSCAAIMNAKDRAASAARELEETT